MLVSVGLAAFLKSKKDLMKRIPDGYFKTNLAGSTKEVCDTEKDDLPMMVMMTMLLLLFL
jgi:hypothetical protein